MINTILLDSAVEALDVRVHFWTLGIGQPLLNRERFPDELGKLSLKLTTAVRQGEMCPENRTVFSGERPDKDVGAGAH